VGLTFLLCTSAANLCHGQLSITKYKLSGLTDIGIITSGSDGNLWFAPYHSAAIGTITTGGGTSYFGLPAGHSVIGITRGPDGNIWFTESGPFIGRITSEGLITEFPLPPDCTNGGFPEGPYQIAAGADGHLWFALGSSLGHDAVCLGRISTEGIVTRVPVPSLHGPVAISSGPDGNIWFADGAHIGRFTADFRVVEFPVLSGKTVLVLTGGPDGNVWFGGNDGLLGRITPKGVVTEFPLPPSIEVRGIAAGPDGKLWFTESSSQIGTITTSGIIETFQLPADVSVPMAIAKGVDRNMWVTFDWGIVRANIAAPPILSGMTPGSAPSKKALTLTVSGSLFLNGSVVRWNGSSLATKFVSEKELTAYVPERLISLPGAFRVDVQNPDGKNSNSLDYLIYPSTTIWHIKSGNLGAQIVCGPNGSVWFPLELDLDESGDKIARLSSGGKLEYFPLPNKHTAGGGMASGRDGYAWFTEDGPYIGRIASGGLITEFPFPLDNQDSGIIWLTAGPDGNVWFTQASHEAHASSYLGKITPDGVITRITYNFPSAYPTNIILGPDGNMWFADGSNVARLTVDFNITRFPDLSGKTVGALTGGPDGNVWFGGTDGLLGRITPKGVVTEFPLPPSIEVRGIAAGPDGKLWFTESGSQIGTITTSGVIETFQLPGLPTSYSIIEGEHGNMWVNEDHAIVRINIGR